MHRFYYAYLFRFFFRATFDLRWKIYSKVKNIACSNVYNISTDVGFVSAMSPLSIWKKKSNNVKGHKE